MKKDEIVDYIAVATTMLVLKTVEGVLFTGYTIVKQANKSLEKRLK